MTIVKISLHYEATQAASAITEHETRAL